IRVAAHPKKSTLIQVDCKTHDPCRREAGGVYRLPQRNEDTPVRDAQRTTLPGEHSLWHVCTLAAVIKLGLTPERTRRGCRAKPVAGARVRDPSRHDDTPDWGTLSQSRPAPLVGIFRR